MGTPPFRPFVPMPVPMVRPVSLLRDEAADYERALNEPAPPPTDASEEARKRKLVAQAMERFKVVAELEAEQRAREVEDLRFDRALPEDQWPEQVRKARAGGVAPDGSVVAERPCLVINKLDQPVQQVISEARKAKLAIQVKPKGGKASKEGAELRQGMIRAIEADSRANLARIWALERAVKCGRGAYRILKTYANDGDFDQDLVISRIKNQGCVYLDPYAQEPDWSDAEWAFITDDMPLAEYKRLYGESDLASMGADDLQSVSDAAPAGWVTGQGERGTIRVAEYFYAIYVQRTLVQDPMTGEEVMLPKGAPLPPGVLMSRNVQQRQIKWAVINASEVLDEEDWDGRYIPIIPVVGKEYVVDGKSVWKGVISNAKDAQRLYNYARSSQALRAGLESLAPWVMAEGQDEGYEQMWDESNTRAFTRLKYKPTTFEGHLLPAPQRNDLNSTNISAAMLMAREADSDIQATTGRFNPSLGKQDSTRSGKAIAQLKQQGELGSSNYLENLANISMVHEGRILLELLPKIYDRPGRIVRLLGEDPQDEKTVLLHQPFVAGQDGRPLPTAPGTPGLISTLMAKLGAGKKVEPAKTFVLDNTSDYTVTVSVGQAQQTKSDANAALLSGLMQAAPQLAPLIADIFVEQQDPVISERIVKRLRKANPQLNDEEDQPEQPQVPAEVQQQLQQLQQQNQQLQAEAQQAKAGIQAAQLKAQADAQIAQMRLQADLQMKQMELASRERIEAAKLRAGVATTQAKVGSGEAIATLKAETQRQTQTDDLMHEQRMRHLDMAHEDHAALRDAALAPVPVQTGPPPAQRAPQDTVLPDGWGQGESE